MKKKSLIIFVVFFISCSGDEVNNYIVTDEELIEVFCEFHLIDAAAKQGVLKNNRNNLIKHKQFKAILVKHKIEHKRFDSTLSYLSQRPKKFVKLYEKVERRLDEDLNNYTEPEE